MKIKEITDNFDNVPSLFLIKKDGRVLGFCEKYDLLPQVSYYLLQIFLQVLEGTFNVGKGVSIKLNLNDKNGVEAEYDIRIVSSAKHALARNRVKKNFTGRMRMREST